MVGLRTGNVLLALVLAVVAAGAAHAAGDAAAGREGAIACKACHGAEGISPNPTFPNLAGQKENYLVKQLKAFRAGERKNDLMASIAKQLSDADIANLAAFWSGLPAGGGPEKPAADANKVTSSLTSLPADFPKGFTLYSTEKDEDSGTLQLRYANASAAAAAKAGKPLPTGSLIVVATHKAVVGPDGKPQAGPDGQWKAAEVLSYSAMESRAGWGAGVPELLRNGDWHYNLFTADKAPRAGLNQAACLACHRPQEANSYVFTLPLLAGK